MADIFSPMVLRRMDFNLQETHPTVILATSSSRMLTHGELARMVIQGGITGNALLSSGSCSDEVKDGSAMTNRGLHKFRALLMTWLARTHLNKGYAPGNFSICTLGEGMLPKGSIDQNKFCTDINTVGECSCAHWCQKLVCR